jgi:antitoxin CptB
MSDHADRLARIKWRSRRGLLELDIIFGRYFALAGDTLASQDLDLLEAALLLPDNDLLDMIMRRQPVDNPALVPLIDRLAVV